MIEYQVEITNTVENSTWNNVTVVDTLPEDLSVEEGGFMLVCPDGTIQTLRMAEHYNPAAHTITVALPAPVGYGESYYLRYRTIVNFSEYVEGVNDTIVNHVAASGTGLDDAVVETGAESGIRHPGTVVPGVSTGDTANVGFYAVMTTASAALFGAVLLLSRRKKKRETD